MSRYTMVEVACPHCGQAQAVHVWQSLNVTLDPSLKADLFQGKINQMVCLFCQTSAVMDTPLLYHDMALAFSVQYYPLAFIDDPAFLANFSADGQWQDARLADLTAGLGGGGDYLLHPHIVFDMKELLRYILFRERLAHHQV